MGAGLCGGEAGEAGRRESERRAESCSESDDSASGDDVDARQVMDRYVMYMGSKDRMGAGSFSICRRGKDTHTNREVAIKVYKTQKRQSQNVTLKKFKRQIEVLLQLQQPLTPPKDGRPWHKHLAEAKPEDLFMQLIDYSKDASGNPGPHTDGVMYVITELASYSLKDLIKERRDADKFMSNETVKIMTGRIFLVVAGLHAKGLVHLDLKPENLMVFSGVLKLIDVDGCVRIGERASLSDSSLSFSPCYCSPEWARFATGETHQKSILIAPELDVWSVGLSICELVTLDPFMKSIYVSFLKHGRSQRDVAWMFLEWLSERQGLTMPKKVSKLDPQLADLLTNWLLVSSSRRRSLADSLDHPYLKGALLSRSQTCPLTTPVEELPTSVPGRVKSEHRGRLEDRSKDVLYKGMLWKLNTKGQPAEKAHWLERDMWITNHGNLCYFSQHEGKRLVLLDGHRLAAARIETLTGSAFDHAFEIRVKPDNDEHTDDTFDVFRFASNNADDLDKWKRKIRSVQDNMVHTIHIGSAVMEHVRALKLQVNNRRRQASKEGQEDWSGFEPAFRHKLWKLKTAGESMCEADWYERDMWLSNNGTFMYHSKKDEKDLIYYLYQDVRSARLVKLQQGQAFRPWAFQVQLPPAGDVEYEPGEFAAESEEMLNEWLQEFVRFGATLAS